MSAVNPPGRPVETAPAAEQAAPPLEPAAAPLDVRAQRRQRRRELLRALLHSKTFLVGAVILAFWVLDAIFWRAIVPHSTQGTDVAATLKGPSGSHWFGT